MSSTDKNGAWAPVLSEVTARRLSALPDLGMAFYVLAVWIYPGKYGAGAIASVSIIFITEFFVTHGSAFIGHYALNGKIPGGRAYLAFFILLYTAFMALVSAASGAWWPMWTFWLLILNRLLPVAFSRMSEAGKNMALGAMIARNATVYLGAVLLALLPLPRLGVDRPVMMPNGAFEPDAHKALAMCFFYFGLQALITLWRKNAPSTNCMDTGTAKLN